jgi:7,8-dihydroneopterin aldolase/epimerase/oxygenase
MTQQPTDTGTVYPLKIADARHSVRHVFVRDLNVDVNIGIHAHERRGRQRVIVNVDLSVTEAERPVRDKIGDVLCYEEVAAGIERIVAEGHINLVETLAERIAQMCLQDDRVEAARVRIEKPDALEQARSVGVEIERARKPA